MYVWLFCSNSPTKVKSILILRCYLLIGESHLNLAKENRGALAKLPKKMNPSASIAMLIRSVIAELVTFVNKYFPNVNNYKILLILFFFLGGGGGGACFQIGCVFRPTTHISGHFIQECHPPPPHRPTSPPPPQPPPPLPGEHSYTSQLSNSPQTLSAHISSSQDLLGRLLSLHTPINVDCKHGGIGELQHVR